MGSLSIWHIIILLVLLAIPVVVGLAIWAIARIVCIVRKPASTSSAAAAGQTSIHTRPD